MVVTASGIGSVSTTFYDVDHGVSNTTSRYSSAGVVDTLGLVTGFNVASVVQASTPASAMLFLIACVGLFIRRK